jgi:hypothetical protein
MPSPALPNYHQHICHMPCSAPLCVAVELLLQPMRLLIYALFNMVAQRSKQNICNCSMCKTTGLHCCRQQRRLRYIALDATDGRRLLPQRRCQTTSPFRSNTHHVVVMPYTYGCAYSQAPNTANPFENNAQARQQISPQYKNQVSSESLMQFSK